MSNARSEMRFVIGVATCVTAATVAATVPLGGCGGSSTESTSHPDAAVADSSRPGSRNDGAMQGSPDSGKPKPKDASGSPDAGTPPLPDAELYSLIVTTPSNNATVSGTVPVRGVAPGFVNVEVWDSNHQNPPIARVTPGSNGAFSTTVDTTALPNGADTWTVWGWNAPAGQPATKMASVTLDLTLDNGATLDAGHGGDASPPGQPLLGFYVQTSSIQSLATALGVTSHGYSSYTDGSNGWSGIGNYTPPSTTMKLLLGVNLCADGDTVTNTPNNLSTYQTLAQHLISGGKPDAIIRLGWEWNGNWFAWSNSGPAAYVAAFQAVHTTMMAVSGAAFKWDWCANAGSSPQGGTTYESWYPGDAYVDYIGTDHYDSTSGDPTTNWNNNLNTVGGLTYTVNFAVAHHKLVSIPEWGLHGSDDPTFINLMAAFVKDSSNDVGYFSYFSCPAGGSCIDSDITQFPNSEAAFRTDFAGF